MKLIIDRDRCEGYGLCAEAAPELMHLDADDELVLDKENMPTSDVPRAEAAVRACPVAALPRTGTTSRWGLAKGPAAPG